MKNQKGISLISIIIIIAIIVVGIIFLKNITKSSYLENITLTKDNFEETMNNYSKLKKDTDDIVYVGYAVMYYTTRDYISNAFNSEATEEDAYVNVYGKTIKELKNEGKSLMKKNNITPAQFKNNLQNI